MAPGGQARKAGAASRRTNVAVDPTICDEPAEGLRTVPIGDVYTPYTRVDAAFPETSAASVSVIASRLRSLSHRSATAVSNDGPTGLARILRRGLAWRYRRFLARTQSSSSALSRLMDRGPASRILHALTGTSAAATASLVAAEGALRKLRLPASSLAPMPADPTVGIVIPVSHDAGLLASVLDSVCKQTYPHWRCVVVDDAVAGGRRSRRRAVPNGRRRIELLRHAARGGPAAARNTGLRHLDSDLVLLLDAERSARPDALADARACIVPWSATPRSPACTVASSRSARGHVGGRSERWRTTGWARRSTGSTHGAERSFDLTRSCCAGNLSSAAGGIRRVAGWRGGGCDLWLPLAPPRLPVRTEPSAPLGRPPPTSSVRRSDGRPIGQCATRLPICSAPPSSGSSSTTRWSSDEVRPRRCPGHGRRSNGRSGPRRQIGMQVAATGSLDPLTNSEQFERPRPAGIARGRRERSHRRGGRGRVPRPRDLPPERRAAVRGGAGQARSGSAAPWPPKSSTARTSR